MIEEDANTNPSKPEADTPLPLFPPPQRSKNLLANLASYQLYSNVVKGGRYVKRPPKGTLDPDTNQPLEQTNRNPYGAGAPSYLRVLPKERAIEYNERLTRSYFLNYCQEIIRVYVATFFQQGYSIERTLITDALGPEISGNLDRLGRAIPDFLRDAWHSALTYGWIGVLTDLPRLSKPFASLAEERAASLRPYSRIVLPIDIWDCSIDPDTGDWASVLLSTGPDSWTLWTPLAWYQLEVDGAIRARGGHSFGRVPLDLLVCDPASLDDPLEPFGHSALRDCASINLEIYQQTSLLEDLTRKTNYPTRVWEISPEQFARETEGRSKDVTLGAGYDIFCSAKVGWITPPNDSAEAGRAYIASLVSEIRRIAGIATRSEESTETHSGAALQWEYSTRLSLVKLRAENLRSFEVRLWKTYSRILGIEIPAESVRYPSTYATQPTPADLSDLAAMQGTSMPPEVIRDQMRSIVVKRFSHLPDLQERLARIDQYVVSANVKTELESIELLEKAKVPQSLIKAVVEDIATRYFSNVVSLPVLREELEDMTLVYYTDPTLRAEAETEKTIAVEEALVDIEEEALAPFDGDPPGKVE